MPELPEVETTCRGIEPHIKQQRVKKFIIRNGQLRWPVDSELVKLLPGLLIKSVSRRGKYILLNTEKGVLMLHLGMSGNLKVLPEDSQPIKHDHVDIVLDNGLVLRLNDPRRFGSVLWHDIANGSIQNHQLISKLGPEPLSDEFNAEYLYEKISKRRVKIKSLVMDSHIVVGVGNIYANEALFTSQIHPETLGQQINLLSCEQLVRDIKNVLQISIEQGGTTLKDFVKPDGNPGYFEQKLRVYGREGQDCPMCQTTIEKTIVAQRASFFCPNCQPYKPAVET